MGTVNDQGIWTYSDSDIVQSWPVFMNLGFNSVSDVVKQLQKGRVIIANNASDYDSKLAAIRKAGANNYDVLIYRKDTKEMLINSNGQLTKIWGGAVETDYVNENASFADYKRYVVNGSTARVSRNIRLSKAGLWLISGNITITNDFDANGAYINVFMMIDGKEHNVGVYNTYNYNKNVMYVSMGPIAKYIDTPGKEVSVSVRLQVDQNTNLGWGGLTIQATKIG
jgi:hypothetical protein|nr:MAG TPA: hypothetical protein [Caudoviricetes sp.]